MEFRELVEKNRSYRRFDESRRVTRDELLRLVNLARLTPSAANQQPLKYILSHDGESNGKIFPTLGWARYLRDWTGPVEGERPAGYIVILADTSITKNIWCDDGIAAQTMLLGAVDMGLGGCIIGSIDHEKLRTILDIPEYMEIRLVLALGKPAETVRIVSADGSIRYWRDESGVHHVPKRPLDEIIVTPKKQVIKGSFGSFGID